METDALLEQLRRALGAAYHVERELGGGGMSRVYVAVDTRLRRQVVVKVLSPELAAGVSAERFEREIQLAAALQQANIVPVLSCGDTDGLPYYVMPFIDGLSVRARLARDDAMPVAEVVNVLRDVTRALAYAHDHGVVHRDIKPENILLSGDAAVVTDFGIAKALSASRTLAPGGTITQVGTSIGTPAYMAPEQAAGDPDVDQRADLYALGCVAYELLTGAPPFHGRPIHHILAAHMTEAPAPVTSKRADIPRELAQLIMRCLEKDATKRPQSAREVLQVLQGTTSNPGDTTRTPRSKRTIGFATLGLIGLAAAGLLARTYMGRSTAAQTDGTIAVLPFVVAASDSSEAYFAEGVADELTTSLAKIPGLHVASRSAAFGIARHAVNAQAAGRELHVATVLEGTVRRAGATLRITAQLTTVADGFVIWSDAFAGDTSDVFSAQDDLARRITAALHDKLSMTPGGRVTTARGTNDQEAYDLYLRARHFWQQRGELGLLRAADLFSKAIQRDSTFARAWAGLAMVQVVLPEYVVAPSDTFTTAGLRNAARALQLDPNLSDGQLALAYGLRSRWEVDSAEVAFRRALALAPDDATAHQWYGDLLISKGQLPQANEQMQQAMRLAPTSAVIANELELVAFEMGKFEDALRWYRRGAELDSTFAVNIANGAVDFAYLKQTDSALAAIRTTERLSGAAIPPATRAVLGSALAVLGRTAEARANVASLDAEATRGTLAAYYPAWVYASLGDADRTMKWLTKSLDAREADLMVLGVCSPPFDFLREDARFKALVARMPFMTCVRG